MKILFLAPEPFFEERGTPIAVRLALQVLAERAKDSVELLTYHLGSTVEIPGITIRRIPKIPLITSVGPGISLQKLICDAVFLVTAFKLVLQARWKGDPFQLIHAVEESVFIAWLLKLCFGTPYIYDMDSSLAMQVTEKWRILRPLQGFLTWAERLAIRSATAVVPVCDALAAIAEAHGSKDTHILRDISLLDLEGSPPAVQDLREEFSCPAEELLILYIGNLEPYQGIDLLLESFALAARQHSSSRVVIIGGSPSHLALYREKARQLGIELRVHFAGPRPVASLNGYLTQADILVSPRVRGNNTPMKIYSYLHVGRAIVATDLPTHTQVLTNSVSMLAAPEPGPFADALVAVLSDQGLRERLREQARILAEEQYTVPVFRKRLNELYDRIELRIGSGTGKSRVYPANCSAR
jgi:glycosyltransferase involved in cell wall biosynthesis